MEDMIFSTNIQLQEYAVDTGIVECIKQAVTVADADIRQAENESKFNYMLSTSCNMRRIGSWITASNYTFHIVNEFV